MKVIAALAACVALTGCAGLPAVAPSPQTQIALAEAGTAVDASYNALATAYLAAAPSLPPTVKASVKAILLQLMSCPAPRACKGYIPAADAAVAVGDAATLQTQIAAAQTLIAQATALLPPRTTP